VFIFVKLYLSEIILIGQIIIELGFALFFLVLALDIVRRVVHLDWISRWMLIVFVVLSIHHTGLAWLLLNLQLSDLDEQFYWIIFPGNLLGIGASFAISGLMWSLWKGSRRE
jgi:hypothetical protein